MKITSKGQLVGNTQTMRERLRTAIASEIYNTIQEEEALSPSQCADIALASVAEEFIEISLRLGAEANKKLWYLLGSNISDIINPADMDIVRESQDLLQRAYVVDDLADSLMEGVN